MDNLEVDKLNIAKKIKLGTTQVKNTVIINNNDEPKISKVLTVSAKPIIENIIINNSCVKFDGVINYDLLVVLENNEIMPLTQKANFSQVFEDSKIDLESTVNIYSNLIELNNISNNASGISYSALVSFDIYLIEKNINVDCAKPSESVFVKEGEFSFDTLINNIVYDSTVNFEVTKDVKINKILFANNIACIKSVIPSNDYFVVSGELYSVITYLSEEGVIKNINKTTTFSEEIECLGANKESTIQVSIKTKEGSFVENNEKGIFNFEVPIQILAQIYNKTTVKCVVDAYSLKNEISLKTQEIEENEFLSSKQIDENILTNFTIADNIPLVDKILSVVPVNISVVNQIVKDRELLLEGIAIINIIYYFEDEDGNNILNSLDVELPYSINLNVQELSLKDNVVIDVVLGDINIKNKRGKDLEILAEIKVNCNIVKTNKNIIATEICVGEEKKTKDYALELYLAKEGQSLWDVAKELNVSITDLVSQNSELTLPLISGEKILVYRQRVVDFE